MIDTNIWPQPTEVIRGWFQTENVFATLKSSTILFTWGWELECNLDPLEVRETETFTFDINFEDFTIQNLSTKCLIIENE